MAWVHVPALDLYVTMRCDMRCRHCFLGPMLGSRTEMSISSVTQLLARAAHSWGTREVAFLGGEPTLSSNLPAYLDIADRLSLQPRIVSNGGATLERLLRLALLRPTVRIAISIDGSDGPRHDSIRRAGSFQRLQRVVTLAKANGNPTTAVVSIGRYNRHDAIGILARCAEMQFDSVNVHYVTDRGLAQSNDVLTPAEWLEVSAAIASTARQKGPTVRLERAYGTSGQRLSCAMLEERELAVMPDGRAFTCMMMIGVPDGHAYKWVDGDLIPNEAYVMRDLLSRMETLQSCPAMPYVNPIIAQTAQNDGLRVECIYDKVTHGPIAS